MLKKTLSLASIFKSLGIGFGRVFNRFLARKIYENGKSAMLSQTSKIELSLERGAYFLEIEGSKTYKNQQKIDEKSYVIWILDFGGLLGRFREGFRRPKSWFGGRKPPKRGWKPPKNQYKIKVKKNSEKSEESGARPSSPGGRPLAVRTPPPWCFSTIILKNECPVQAGSKF